MVLARLHGKQLGWRDTARAMSKGNVEILRRSNEAFDRRDRAAFIALHSDDYEIVPAREFPETGVIRGPGAAWDFYVNFFVEAFQGQTPYSDMADLSDAGEDKVLAHTRGRMRGGSTGAEVDTEAWMVATFRDGMIVRDQWFFKRGEALEAAGLRE